MSNGTTAVPVSPVVNDLISTINAGQAAMARVPELEAHVRDLQARLDACQAHNQGLELNAQNYREQIANLNEKVRSLVVERDDASFREMEVQDKLDSLRKVVETALGGLSHAVERVAPPKAPEPVKEEPEHPLPSSTGSSGTTSPSTSQPLPDTFGHTQGGESQSAPSPTVPTPQAASTEHGSAASGSTGDAPSNEGQSATHPISASTESASVPPSVDGHGAEKTPDVSSGPQSGGASQSQGNDSHRAENVPWWQRPEGH